MKKIKKNINELFEENWHKDRKTIEEVLEKLKNEMRDIESFAINGMTLTKLIELLQKQNAQLLELIKINQKNNKEEDSSLNQEDVESIYDEIKKEKLSDEN